MSVPTITASNFATGVFVLPHSKIRHVMSCHVRFILRSEHARKVNHSCAPNAGYRDNLDSGGMDYYAFKDIKEGEEIVTDYAMGNYIVNYMPECLCGSERYKALWFRTANLNVGHQISHYPTSLGASERGSQRVSVAKRASEASTEE